MDRNKIINIVCVVVILASVAGMGVMLPGVVEKLNGSGGSGGGEQSGNSGGSGAFDCANLPPFSSLTKEEAFGFMESALAANVFAFTLCDFVPANVVGTRDIRRISLEVADLGRLDTAKIAEDAGWKEVLSVDRSDDRYAVITGKVNDTMQDVFAGTTQERLIVFDENYLSIDSNYNPVFLKRDAEFVEVVLKIVTYSSMGMVNRFSSGVGLYSYEMKDTGDTYEFVLNYLLIGPDASSDDAKSERLRMQQERYAIDKVTGISESSAFSTGILRSYILTDAELDRLEEIVASRGF